MLPLWTIPASCEDTVLSPNFAQSLHHMLKEKKVGITIFVRRFESMDLSLCSKAIADEAIDAR